MHLRWTSLAIILSLCICASGSRRSQAQHVGEQAEPAAQQHPHTREESCEEHAVLYGQVQQDLLPFRLAGITEANLNASLNWCVRGRWPGSPCLRAH
jgi:hypothetical protein